MFHRILFPSDFVQRDSAALAQVKDLAISNESTVFLLHVIETIRDTSFDEMRDFYRDLEGSVRSRMQPVYDELTAAGIRCEEHIVFGSRVREVMRCATEWKADLIVLQSHRINPDEPFEGWGSMSQKIAHLASIPVMLVK